MWREKGSEGANGEKGIRGRGKGEGGKGKGGKKKRGKGGKDTINNKIIFNKNMNTHFLDLIDELIALNIKNIFKFNRKGRSGVRNSRRGGRLKIQIIRRHLAQVKELIERFLERSGIIYRLRRGTTKGRMEGSRRSSQLAFLRKEGGSG